MQTLIPRFYFPNGKPCPDENIEQRLKDAAKVFQDHPNGEVPQSAFHEVTKVRAIITKIACPYTNGRL